MPDVRALPSSFNGKLIYQLTSATALKDTDLFAISTSDHLTRSVTLSQIKAFATSDVYNIDDIDNKLTELKLQIKNMGDQIFELDNDITEFKNEFINKLNELNESLTQTINNLDKKLTENIEQVNNSLTTKINNTETSLTQKIEALDKKLESWIMYGTAVPTTLPTGRVYLQYF